MYIRKSQCFELLTLVIINLTMLTDSKTKFNIFNLGPLTVFGCILLLKVILCFYLTVIAFVDLKFKFPCFDAD
jgi:uncharacterized membrane protein